MTSPNEQRDWHRAIVVIVAAGVIRLIIAALTPLFPDETYYWEWSRRLAPGYFDHPPMIAWLIRVGTALAGHTAFGVRLLPVVAGAVGAYFIAASARRIAGDRAALIAAVVFAVMPLSAAGLILATPDAPLFAFAPATLYAVLRALESPPRSRSALLWWIASGVALGLALTAKYTAVLLPFGVFVALISVRELRERLAEPGPYVATALGLLIFAPVIAWNARHEWISFAFQLKHGLGGTTGAALKRELELLGGQAALVTPVLFALCVKAIVDALRPRQAPPPREPVLKLLAITAITTFAVFVYSATRRRVEANWPALAYVPTVVLLAAVSVPAYALADGVRRRYDGWLRLGIALAVLLTAVTYVNAFIPILPVPARRDPAARAAGWRDLAREVNHVANAAPSTGRQPFIAADRYQDASELAFHLPGQPTTFALNLSTRTNQYDLWRSFASSARQGDTLIVVVDEVDGTHPTIATLQPHFDSSERRVDVLLARGGDPVKRLRIWVLAGWRGTWPSARLRSPP